MSDPVDRHRERRRIAHQRAAGTHERAAQLHRHAASWFTAHGLSADAQRETTIADGEDANARLERERASQQ